MHFRRCGLTAIDALYCDILDVSVSFSSSRMASYHFSHMASVLLMPPSRHFFWPVHIDRLVPEFASNSFPDLVHFLHRLSHSECCFGHLVLGCLYLPHGLPPAISWLRRPRPAPDPALCVPPPSGWNDASPLVGHQYLRDQIAGSSDLAHVVGDGPEQLTRISLFPCHFPRA